MLTKKEQDKLAKEILADMAGMPIEASLDDITKKLIFGNDISQEKQIENAIKINNNFIAVYPKGRERDFDS